MLKVYSCLALVGGIGFASTGVAQVNSEPTHEDGLSTVAIVNGKGLEATVQGIRIRGKEKLFTTFFSLPVTLAYQGELSRWSGHAHGVPPSSVTDVGFTPVLRLYTPEIFQLAPYVETGIGVHVISPTHFNGTRDMSTAFQFGEFLEGGVLLGSKKQFGVGYFIQHISNGKIKQPNDGYTYTGVKLFFRLEF
jgi:Lipid A 3-O-deacylase (PagL)